MILLLVLQSFETTRLDVPVVGRPTIGGFHITRVDVPVIGRPSTGSAFPRGWSLSLYRARLMNSSPAPLGQFHALIAGSAAPPSVAHAFLQSSLAIVAPVSGSSVVAAPVTGGAATVTTVASAAAGAAAGAAGGARIGP